MNTEMNVLYTIYLQVHPIILKYTILYYNFISFNFSGQNEINYPILHNLFELFCYQILEYSIHRIKQIGIQRKMQYSKNVASFSGPGECSEEQVKYPEKGNQIHNTAALITEYYVIIYKAIIHKKILYRTKVLLKHNFSI